MSNFSLFFFLNRFKILTFFDRSLTGRLFLYFFSNFIIFLTFSRATTRFTIFHLTIFLLNKVESNNKVNCDVLKKKKRKEKIQVRYKRTVMFQKDATTILVSFLFLINRIKSRTCFILFIFLVFLQLFFQFYFRHRLTSYTLFNLRRRGHQKTVWKNSHILIKINFVGIRLLTQQFLI